MIAQIFLFLLLVFNTTCNKQIVDPCTILVQKIKAEWKPGGVIKYRLHNYDQRIIYYSDELDLAALFENPAYKACFMKMHMDTIESILGEPSSGFASFPSSGSLYCIEKPCFDSLYNNKCNLTIWIYYNDKGYISNIRRAKDDPID